MNCKYPVLALSVACLIGTSACSTRQVVQNEGKFPSIERMYFNNTVDINNVEELGVVVATATVTETYQKSGNILTIKADGIEAVRRGCMIKRFKITGEGYQFGELLSIDSRGATTLGGFDFFSRLFAKLRSGKPVVDFNRYLSGKNLAKAMAEYRLMRAAQEKGATAVMVPQYDWTIKYDDRSIAWGHSSSDRTYVYTLTITAKAINFKPDQRTFNIIR